MIKQIVVRSIKNDAKIKQNPAALQKKMETFGWLVSCLVCSDLALFLCVQPKNYWKNIPIEGNYFTCLHVEMNLSSSVQLNGCGHTRQVNQVISN